MVTLTVLSLKKEKKKKEKKKSTISKVGAIWTEHLFDVQQT